ncbi:MAG: hypothetical protein KDD45_17405 [Bdellovibrionales bacterium]|nr:hypothetical protein [Bdellovibrionales bacterium]
MPDLVKSDYNFREPENWECKKVNLDGVIGDGRFLIKRSRGTQEGYLIMAPFIISSKFTQTYVPE